MKFGVKIFVLVVPCCLALELLEGDNIRKKVRNTAVLPLHKKFVRFWTQAVNEDIILSMFCNGTSYDNDQITGFWFCTIS